MAKKRYGALDPTPPAGSGKFVVAPHTLQFRCETAVYRDGSGTSVCYVTSSEMGGLVAAALNAFQESGGLAEYVKANGGQD